MVRPKNPSKRFQRDPTNSQRRINAYERELVKLFKNYKVRVVSDLKQMNSRSLESVRIDPKAAGDHLTRIEQEEILDPAEKIVKKKIPESYKAGGTFADIQLGGTQEQRQNEWKKIAALIEKNNQQVAKSSSEISGKIRQKLADAVINERSLGDMIDDIRAIADIGVSKARTIAKTEIMIATNTGIKDRYKQAGVEKGEWLAAADDIVCFPANTMVMTDIGERPIQYLKAGDRVLTRSGFKQVLKTHNRRYSGELISIKSEIGGLVCTSNHPIYVIGKGWLRADILHNGDTLQSFNNKPTQIAGIENIFLTQSDDVPSMLHKKFILSRIFNRIVPILPVNLNHNIRFFNKKINRIPSYFCFLNEIGSNPNKSKSYFFFKRGLPREFSVTRKTTKSTICFSRSMAKLFATIFTFGDTWRPSAFFRAIFSVLVFCPKLFPAPQTSVISGINQSTLCTTDSIPIRTRCHYLESNTTYRANFFHLVVMDRVITIARTIFSTSFYSTFKLFKRFSACGADRDYMGNSRGMITRLAAKFNLFCMSVKFIPTKQTMFYHSPHPTIIDRIYHVLLGTIIVYNLSTEDIHEYYANGILVHNCDECESLDTQQFPLDSFPDCPAHPNCRCSIIPVIEIPGEEVEPVEEPDIEEDDPFKDWDTSEIKDELLESDIEIAYVYDKDGNLIGKYVGDSNSVTYPAPPPDSYTVHNHPDNGNNVASFSPEDVYASIQTGETETRIISQETGIEYSIKPGPNGWPSEDKFNAVYNAEIDKLREYVKEGLNNGSFDAKSAEKYGREEMNNIMKDVFEQTGIIYNERKIS